MGSQPSVKVAVNGVYDEELHARFLLWRDQSGQSVSNIARKMNSSTARVSQYINRIYPGNIQEVERDILSLLRREEDLEFTVGPRAFCKTGASIQIWEVLQFCDQKRKMGAALAPSGTGKTETCKEYKRQNRAKVFITADITTKSPSPILRRVIEQVGGVTQKNSTSQYLQALIDRLKGSNRLLIIDDAHFLNWESFELIRKVHDCARIGVVYIGQERLYEQMKGAEGRAYLFDQIYSRIAIKRDRFQILKKDAGEIAKALCPAFDKDCLDYLYQKAKSKGRYRYMTNLIDVALEIHKQYGTALGLPLLQEAERFLLGA